MTGSLSTILLIPIFTLLLTVSVPFAEVIEISGNEDETIETSTILDDVPARYAFSVTKEPSHGGLSFREPNYLTYTPHPNYNGSDDFSVNITITYYCENEKCPPPFGWEGNYVVTVLPVNDFPIADPLSATTTKGTPVSLELSGSDPVEGSSLTYAIWTLPNHGVLSDASHGEITEAADKHIVYTPDAGFLGDDSFDYVVFDGEDFSYEAVARISVFDPAFAKAVLIGSSSYFYRIGDAYDSAEAGGTVIRIRGIEFPDPILLDQDKQVTLEGGYDENFASNAGMSTSVPAPMTIKSGTAVVANLLIR